MMQKEDIINKLEDAHSNLFEWLNNQDVKGWETGPENKWTTGQHAMHLLQSIQPLNKALGMPKFLLKYKFGKANREVREFDAIAARYNERLKESKGITFRGSQNMKVPSIQEKRQLLEKLQVENKKLQRKTQKWKDKDLDVCILPHPLMGKMPVREIIMWTAYHVNHHLETLKEHY